MASVTDLAKHAQKFTIDNSPFLLTLVASAGVVGTAVLAAKGGIKAERLLQENAQLEWGVRPEHLTFKQKAKSTWKCYLPAIGAGVLTCGAVIGANQIGTRRAAAMATALGLSERAFTEYRDKVVEKIGATKEGQVRDDIAQDKFSRDLDSAGTVVISGQEQLCFDGYSARYFKSTMEELKAAVNRVNHKIINDNYASLSDFYDYIGLEHTQVSDEVGWNVDKLLDINFHAVIGPEGKPAIAMEYRTEPIRDYFRLR